MKSRCCVYPCTFELLLSAPIYIKNKHKKKQKNLLWYLHLKDLKSMFQRRQALPMFCRAEEGFILSATLVLCLLLAPTQDYICLKQSASIFCATLHFRVKINGNSQIGQKPRLIWQPNWKTNWEGMKTTVSWQTPAICVLSYLVTSPGVRRAMWQDRGGGTWEISGVKSTCLLTAERVANLSMEYFYRCFSLNCDI